MGGAAGGQRTAVSRSSLQANRKPAAGSATAGRQLSWELLTELSSLA